MRRSVIRRGGLLLVPLVFGLAACEQTATAPELEQPDALLAKGGNKGGGGKKSDDGGHIPLSFTFHDGDEVWVPVEGDGGEIVWVPIPVGVRSDGNGAYVDGADADIEPVQAFLSQGGGKNAYLRTYWSTRTVCLTFDGVSAADDAVLADLVASGEFPGTSFCAPSLLFLANRSTFGSIPIMPADGNRWEFADYPAAELEFYPQGMEGPTYDIHYSSLSVVQTAPGVWNAVSHEQTTMELSVVRRRSNKRLAYVTMHISFDFEDISP